MSKTKVFSMPLLLLVLLTASCSRGEEALFEPGMGGVRIDLATELPETRADVAEGSLNTDEFKVELINSSGVIFKRWETFAEYKAQENEGIHMNAGHYKVRATYGDSTASGWDAWFFMGEQEFDVKPQEMEELSVVCKMANVKVAVVYGENLRADYQDYTATVSNSRGSLVFGKDCAEAGYLPVGTLSVNMELTDVSGKKLYYRSADVSAAAGDFITLNLDTKAAPQGGMGLSLDVDYGTNDKTVEVGISDAFLPAEKPVLSLTGFDAESGQLSFVESNDPGEASVTLTWDPKASPVKSLRLKSESGYFKEHDLPSEVDFCSLTSTDRDLLLNAGLLFPEMSGEMTANMVKLEFDGLAPKLEYDDDETANTHTFTIEATDSKDNVVTKTVTIVPIQASKSLSEIQPGNVWARRAYLTLNTDGDPSKLTVQVKENGTELWYTPEGTEYSVSGKTSSATVKGLKSNTKYAFRAVYNGFAAAEAPEMTTEVAQQVGNAGFEEWTTMNHEFTYEYWLFGTQTERHDISWDQPWIGEQWWAVNSKKTMPSSTSVVSSNWNWVRFPTVAYTTDANDGKAAMIYSVNVGDWLTSTASVGDRVAGELFIGTADDSGNHSSDGHDFGSRPDILRFHFKYQSVNSETFYVKVELRSGNDVIASAERSDVGQTSSWTPMDMPLVYADEMQKATSIYIIFKSTTAEKPEVIGNYNLVIRDGKSEKGNFGSILYVDDIELIYE